MQSTLRPNTQMRRLLIAGGALIPFRGTSPCVACDPVRASPGTVFPTDHNSEAFPGCKRNLPARTAATATAAVGSATRRSGSRERAGVPWSTSVR
jgi:hypothetical protein